MRCAASSNGADAVINVGGSVAPEIRAEFFAAQWGRHGRRGSELEQENEPKNTQMR